MCAVLKGPPLLSPFPDVQVLCAFSSVLLNPIGDFRVEGTYGAYFMFGKRTVDPPVSGLATYLQARCDLKHQLLLLLGLGVVGTGRAEPLLRAARFALGHSVGFKGVYCPLVWANGRSLVVRDEKRNVASWTT